MRLLLLGPATKLDYGGSGISQGEHDLFPLRTLHRHLRLRCEDQIVPEWRIGPGRRRTAGQKGQRRQSEYESRCVPRSHVRKLCDLAFAVQQEQIACRPCGDRSASGWHTDSRQPGNQQGSVAAPQRSLVGQGGDDWPCTCHQHHVGALPPDPALHSSVGEHFDHPAARRANLGRGWHDRILDEQLGGFPGVGQRVQRGRTPFQVRIRVRNSKHAYGEIGSRLQSNHERFSRIMVSKNLRTPVVEKDRS